MFNELRHKMKLRINFVNTAYISSYITCAASIALLIWISVGHHYRTPFNKQFDTFHDGVNLFEAPSGFPDSRDKSLDKFDYELYEKVRSVSDAVKHIKQEYTLNTDVDAMHAVFDFTSKRYLHRMYPIHSLKTNPFFVLLELYDPLNSFNEMSTANELLRHSAIGGCGDTTVTAIEIYRALGHQAQYVSLDGHHVAEFIAGDKKWLVDADMEVIAPYSIQHIRENLELVPDIYAKFSPRRQSTMQKIFAKKGVHANGYSGAPRYGDYMWNLHKLIEKAKWIIPLSGIILSLIMIIFLRKYITKTPSSVLSD